MEHDRVKAEFLASYDEHAQAIYRFCILKVSDRERAQDLTQEVFMRYWQSLRSGDSIKNHRAYLYTLARNLIIDWYRRKKESSLDAITETGLDFAGTDASEILNTVSANQVLNVIQELDDESRDVLLLRFVEGYTPKEIAEILKTTPNVISVRVHRAIKKVQERIHHEG